MSALKSVEPGWLAKTVAEAGRRLRAQFTPQYLIRLGQTVTLPIDQREASELYQDLNAHFRAWTGRSLAEFEADQRT